MKSIQRSILSIFLLLVLLWPAKGLHAQDDEFDDKTLSPYFLVISDDPENDQLPLKKTSADVNIAGVIADITITQVYENEGENTLEAIYTFPASSNAAVYAMEMKIGDRKIVAKIEEKNKARENYEQAKSEGKRVSLLEQDRPNVFTMNVANITPGDVIEVSLKYTELLIPESGVYKFIYPTVVGPRYSEASASDESSDEKFVNTPYTKEGEAPLYDFDINVYISTGMPIQNTECNTHKVNISYLNTSIAQIDLDASEKNGGDRDFVIEYKLAGDKIQSGLMLYEHEDENFFLLMMQPPKQVKKDEIPPREYIFIIDVSGSMRGFPLDVSKTLMRNLVTNLKPTDRFNVLLFAGTSGWFADTSMFASTENIEKAIKFIDNQRGGGGTRLLPAMEKALKFPRMDESLSRSFVIITDGYISVEKAVFDLIRNNLDQANIFSFGIGSSINRYLIEGMARVGQGEPLIVLNKQGADEKAEKFRNYINNPVLTQIKKNFGKLEVYDVEPITVPDVLAERPVIIYGKYKGDPQGTVTIKGFSGKKKYKETFEVADVKPDKKNSAIRYLWARERIKLLDDYNQLSYDEKHVKEVTDLGLKYSLMTAYTSFIAIDDEVVNEGGDQTSVKQALPLPENVSNYAVGAEMNELEVPSVFDMATEDIEIEEVIYHQDIIITADIAESQLNEIKRYIEENLISDLDKCHNIDHSQITNIQVKVNKEGEIINITVSGNPLTDDVEKCIKEVLSKWSFKKLNLEGEWLFDIKF